MAPDMHTSRNFGRIACARLKKQKSLLLWQILSRFKKWGLSPFWGLVE
jgi:hypothetical protein